MRIETRIAETMLRNLQRGHPPVHCFQEVDGASFAHVSQRHYRRTTAVLEKLGFTVLGDVEDVTTKEIGNPDPRSFIRTMVDADRTTTAAFWHFAPKILWRLAMLVMRLPSKSLEFHSSTADGIHQITTNIPAWTQSSRPATIRTDYAPRSLCVADLQQRHLQNLGALHGSLRRVVTVAELIAFQVEQHAQIRAHLEAIGWVTRDYLRAQGVRESQIATVYDETQRLLSEGIGDR